MWQSAKVAVVVPCFREARLIGRTLSGMPAFVDLIVVVDDASDDGTAEAVRGAADPGSNSWCTRKTLASVRPSSAVTARL